MTIATQGRPWRRKATGLKQAAGLPSRGLKEVYGVKISTDQINKIKQGESPTKETVDEAVIRLTDKELIKDMVARIHEMPDREDMVAELQARIEAGEYNPTGDEIADAMIRRAIADSVR